MTRNNTLGLEFCRQNIIIISRRVGVNFIRIHNILIPQRRLVLAGIFAPIYGSWVKNGVTLLSSHAKAILQNEAIWSLWGKLERFGRVRQPVLTRIYLNRACFSSLLTKRFLRSWLFKRHVVSNSVVVVPVHRDWSLISGRKFERVLTSRGAETFSTGDPRTVKGTLGIWARCQRSIHLGLMIMNQRIWGHV